MKGVWPPRHSIECMIDGGTYVVNRVKGSVHYFVQEDAMNKRQSILVTMMASLAAALMLVLVLSASGAAAQGPTGPTGGGGTNQPVGTAFTYQGQLKNGGNAVNGNCDFAFYLMAIQVLSSQYVQVGSPVTVTNVAVTNGLFNVSLDFGTGNGIFSGEARYLSINVRCPTGSGSYTDLGKQSLTAAPYALGLVPGAAIRGTAYQTLKVMNDHPDSDIPAAVTGEIESSPNGIGLFGINYTASPTGTGVYGQQGSGSLSTRQGGVVGYSSLNSGSGVVGEANNGTLAAGVRGQSSSGLGVLGYSSSGVGVYGVSEGPGAIGVYGLNTTGNGVAGYSASGYAVYGYSDTGYGGYFHGDVHISGNLSKSGGSFKIDDPLDPANKYLSHSFVESPDMKNIYDGVATLDANGEAVVTLPDWFEALNRDFRYQLTCVGGYAPVYVAEEVHDNAFKIAGGKSGLKVSWQVTGIRQDAWANAHRIPVEEDKPANEAGTYLHPDLFGQPATAGVDYTQTHRLEPNAQSAVPSGQP